MFLETANDSINHILILLVFNNDQDYSKVQIIQNFRGTCCFHKCIMPFLSHRESQIVPDNFEFVKRTFTTSL